MTRGRATLFSVITEQSVRFGHARRTAGLPYTRGWFFDGLGILMVGPIVEGGARQGWRVDCGQTWPAGAGSIQTQVGGSQGGRKPSVDESGAISLESNGYRAGNANVSVTTPSNGSR